MGLERARLYLVIGARPDIAEAALRGGVDIVQLRVKEVAADELLPVARGFRKLCSQHDALFIVNDLPELALRCGADGVHLGQDDMPVAQARRLLGEDILIGLSTHTAGQVAAATAADYIGVGPVFATPTKPAVAPVGLDLVRTAKALAAVPWFAIGGIDSATIGAVTAAGATRVAVVRAIAAAADPGAAARSLAAHLRGLPATGGTHRPARPEPGSQTPRG